MLKPIMATDFSSWDWESIAPAMNYLLPVIVGFLGVMVLLVTSEYHHKIRSLKKFFKCFCWVSIPLAIFGFVAQFMAYSNQKQFNTDLARYYEDKFDGMENKRSVAASEISEYLKSGNWDLVKNTAQLDSVLDFFDDLGFYSENKQISDEVLHQEFYSYMRTYCQPAERYIKETEIDEPAVWNHVLPLLTRLTDIESIQSKTTAEQCVWPKSKLLEYAKAEIDLVTNSANAEAQSNSLLASNIVGSAVMQGGSGNNLSYVGTVIGADTNQPTFAVEVLTDKDSQTFTKIFQGETIVLPKNRTLGFRIWNTSQARAENVSVSFFADIDRTNFLLSDSWLSDIPGFVLDDGTNSRVVFQNFKQLRWIAPDGMIFEGWQRTPLPDLVISNNYSSSSIQAKIYVNSINSGLTWRQFWLVNFKFDETNK